MLLCVCACVQNGVTQVAPELLALAQAADIVTFGSPSAVKAWVALVGLTAAQAKVCTTSLHLCGCVSLSCAKFCV